jgi:hypothetical protein
LIARLAKYLLMSCCAVLTVHAFAQSADTPRSASTVVQVHPSERAAVAVPEAPKVAAIGHLTKAGPPSKPMATSGTVILADGIVANAKVATVESPAEGFEYER